MSYLGRRVAQLIAAIDRTDYPKDGVCSHHGIGFNHGGLRIGIAPRGRGTLVTVYAIRVRASGPGRGSYEDGDGGYFVGYPAHIHNARVRHIAAACKCLTLETWNGADGHNGISLVLDRPCPESLARCIANYSAVNDVFALTETDRANFQAFTTWYDGVKTA